MSQWPKVRLSECLQPTNDIVSVQRDQEYPNFGIYSYARGLFRKLPINGLASSANTLRRVRKGQFIYSRLFAFEGAYGIVGDEFDGSFVSNEYPTFICDETRIMPQYLIAYFSMRCVWEAVAKGSKGLGVRRQRVQPEEILAHEIPLVPLDVQCSIVARLESVAEKRKQVAAKLDAVQADAEHLLAIRFRDIIADTDWRPMGEVAPVVRRNVEVCFDQKYREVGARSFGKGLFHKPDFNGAEATWQKPVWIELGDIVISNIKAWEGAIAVAGLEHAGCIASHRYLTCVPDPNRSTADFLCYYLLSPDGLDQVGLASPGTADRNRTLSQASLVNIRVPLPPLEHQHAFNSLQAKVAEMMAKHTDIRRDLEALFPSMLERVFHSEMSSP